MNIHDAVIEATRTGRCITTPDFEGYSKIRPTNGDGNCILMDADGSHPTRHGWQPMADELMREDWILVD